jgi:hypothetical protein
MQSRAIWSVNQFAPFYSHLTTFIENGRTLPLFKLLSLAQGTSMPFIRGVHFIDMSTVAITLLNDKRDVLQ